FLFMQFEYRAILICFLLLIFSEYSMNRNKIVKTIRFTKSPFREHLKKIQQFSSHPSLGTLQAIATGDKRKVHKKVLESFKRMGLMHLLTPSGIHLNSILWIDKLFPPRFVIIF